MGDLFDFPLRQRQDPRTLDPSESRARREAWEALDEARGLVFQAALQLACAGPWRAWDEAQPIGAEVCFEVEDLLRTGDRRVTALASLLEAFEEAAAAFDDNVPF